MWSLLDRNYGLVICVAFFLLMLWKGIALLPVSDAAKHWLWWGSMASTVVYLAVLLVRFLRCLPFGGGANYLDPKK